MLGRATGAGGASTGLHLSPADLNACVGMKYMRWVRNDYSDVVVSLSRLYAARAPAPADGPRVEGSCRKCSSPSTPSTRSLVEGDNCEE